MIKNKVIYICSDVRSGSTLIDTLLSQHNKISSIGEGHHFFDYNNTISRDHKSSGYLCTCGEIFSKCEYWLHFMKIFKNKNPDCNLSEFRTKYSRNRKNIIRLLIHLTYFILPNFILCYFSFYKFNKSVTINRFKLYQTICSINKTQYVVDSSKWPEAIYFYFTFFKNKSLFLFVKRDLRALCYSKFNRNPKNNSIKKSFYSSLGKYVLISLYKRLIPSKYYYEVDYQIFSKEPKSEFLKLGDFLGINDLESVIGNSIKMDVKHNLGGSPHRFNNIVNIKEDIRWKNDDKFKNELQKILMYRLFFK